MRRTYGDSSTEQWSDLSRVRVLRNAYSGFGTQRGILAIAALTRDAVDYLIGAHLEKAAAASLARVVVTAVPWTTNTVSDLPLRLRRRDRDHSTHEFVAEAEDLSISCVSICF